MRAAAMSVPLRPFDAGLSSRTLKSRSTPIIQPMMAAKMSIFTSPPCAGQLVKPLPDTFDQLRMPCAIARCFHLALLQLDGDPAH